MAAAVLSSAPRTRRFDSLEQQAYLNLWRTYDALKAIEDGLFAPRDLSAQQYNALRLLQAVHPGSIPTLALGAKLISRAPDMTRLLDKLETRGLIVRERSPQNRRVVNVSIADAGLALLDELAGPVRECHRRQLGHLSAKSLRELVALLKSAREPHEDSTRPTLVDTGR
jgi:DNA-binding MarR family transcriptional regulator